MNFAFILSGCVIFYLHYLFTEMYFIILQLNVDLSGNLQAIVDSKFHQAFG